MGNNNVDTTEELPTVLSFCSGYGGIERGLDLAGVNHRVIAFVEIESYAIANLVSKMESGQLPPAPIYTDLKTFPGHLFRDAVDIITGGYPCQPFSTAGMRKGKEDPRHLWPCIRQHISAIRPIRCFFENVQGHVSLGLSTVISDLEEDGFKSTFGLFSANEVGAPHERKRVFVMADSNNTFSKRESLSSGMDKKLTDLNSSSPSSRGFTSQHWVSEPGVARVVDGCPHRVDRHRLLGNAVVPQTAARAWQVLSQRF